MNVRKLFDGSVAYYLTDRFTASGTAYHQFPSPAGPTPSPAILGPTKVTTASATWDAVPTWDALTFAVEDPHFCYQYASSGTNEHRPAMPSATSTAMRTSRPSEEWAKRWTPRWIGAPSMMRVNEID